MILIQDQVIGILEEVLLKEFDDQEKIVKIIDLFKSLKDCTPYQEACFLNNFLKKVGK